MGRAANEALSRVVALRLSRLQGGNAIATPDDYGFVLTVGEAQAIRGEDLPALIATAGFEEGEQKSVRKLQWSTEVIFNVLQQHEPDHVLLREAWQDAIHTYIDSAGAIAYLSSLEGKPVRLQRVDRVPPLSFAMFATKIKEALLVEDPREMMERLYHLWWERIQET
jgi:ATP-dependent Lhr-like helicase